MIKFLLLGLIVYTYYKFFLAPKKIATRDQDKIQNRKDEDGEYVDYEEVEWILLKLFSKTTSS